MQLPNNCEESEWQTMDKDKDIEILTELYRVYCCAGVNEVSRLPGAGSGRRYFRLSGSRIVNGQEIPFSCIGVAGDSERDCRAFVSLAKVFGEAGVAVPEVYVASPDYMHYIQEDLGDTSLFSVISSNTADGDAGGESVAEKLVKEVMTSLVRMQTVKASLWEDHVEYNPFGRRQAMWDLNYFKYEYLRPSGFDFDEDRLEDDFERFADDLTKVSETRGGFMYRDFQSRNVMLSQGRPYFIDFQGGRRGPGVYDAISFLWQAKAGFTNGFRNRMMDHYFNERCAINGEARHPETETLQTQLFALFRTLQVLGAYGLRGLVERKAYFIESIPGALSNLKDLINIGAADRYPELKRVCAVIISDVRFLNNSHDGLQISVFSFSYKKGYPSDFTGNGGGFMFDCRGMHNPGRYIEYRNLTGRDKPVADFLEERGEVQEFASNALRIVSPSVETYLRRGFSSLQIGFGCTGGQHRSVYCAERVARELAERYPSACVRLIHREQNIDTLITPKKEI